MKTEEPRAYTVEEAREMFLAKMRAYVKYWAGESRVATVQEKLDGLAFSILNIIDGTSSGLPRCNLTVQPHPNDKEYCRSQGENWYEPGMVINDVMLHEMYYRTPAVEENTVNRE
jgi:hypothetical protein